MGEGKYEGGLHPKDKEILRSAQTGEGLTPITSKELKEMAKAAREISESFKKIAAGMTKEQASEIRKFRVNEECTWRGVAQKAWNAGLFGRTWNPPSNQLMGVALCERAAEFHGEDHMKGPWN